MDGLERELWVARRPGFGEWALGTVKSFAVIAGWALLAWMLAAALQASGLLPASVQSEQHEPSVDDHPIERANV